MCEKKQSRTDGWPYTDTWQAATSGVGRGDFMRLKAPRNRVLHLFGSLFICFSF